MPFTVLDTVGILDILHSSKRKKPPRVLADFLYIILKYLCSVYTFSYVCTGFKSATFNFP